jgi:NAD(P)-dependent dehydrogenase (short-subunit alcohol dehydrogenase family)
MDHAAQLSDTSLDLSGRRILVTGGSGFLGRAVLRSLVQHGADDVLAPRAVEFDLTASEGSAPTRRPPATCTSTIC